MPRLVDRVPHVEADRLISELVPPPRFAAESFATYLPDPAQPTQAAAVAGLHAFAAQMNTPAPATRILVPPTGAPGGTCGHLPRRRLRRRQDPPARLAVARRAPGRKAFGTFVEYTHLVGALGFAQTVEAAEPRTGWSASTSSSSTIRATPC